MSSTRGFVLIVDNEDGFHGILRLVLEPLGFAVESAFNGEEGLERFKLRPYDVVFSDVHMPKMHGPELLENIRHINPAQPVVMMTSGSDPEGKFEQSIDGDKATICMYKPFEINEVIKAVESVLGIPITTEP